MDPGEHDAPGPVRPVPSPGPPEPAVLPVTHGRPAPPEPASLLAINLRYFAIRIALFGAVLAVIMSVFQMDGLLAFALAVVLSGLAGYPLAVRQRRAVVGTIEARRGRSR
jgi:hypothetical protein